MRETVGEYSYLYPVVADQVMDIFNNGENHWMRPVHEPTREADTIPHKRALAILIVKTLRGDFNEGCLLVCRKSSVAQGINSPMPTGEVV